LTRWEGTFDPGPWQAAVEGWAPIGFPHERGWALLHRAEALVEGHRREDASRALHNAAVIADQLGAQPLARDVAAFARRARLPAKSAPATEPAKPAVPPTAQRLGLTERELEVPALLSQGLSKGAIGKHLYISPKTGSVHVTHINKLGVTIRTRAGAIAYRLGLERPAW